MTTIIQAIILGIVQGITEWLPVSSSGHLVIMQHFFNLQEQIAMDLILHIGTLLVVIFFFRKDLIRLIKGVIRACRFAKVDRSFRPFITDNDSRLAIWVIVASIPTAIIGLLLKSHIEQAFESLMAVGIALIITGILLMCSKRCRNRDIKSFNWKDALIIGIAQGMAIFPGISRSGSTIAVALFRGLNKELAARFSFIIFIPAMIGATILQFDKFSIPKADLIPILAGTITAMIVSYIVIGLLLTIVKKEKLHYFSWYCWALGIALIVLN